MLTVNLESLRLDNGALALDLGCGPGRHLHGMYFAAKCYTVGVDLAVPDLQKAADGFAEIPDVTDTHQRWSLAAADALRLPFDDATFDTIVCSEVLEHIPDYHQAIAEIARVIKPGGRLAVSVPRYWPERICWALSEHYHNTPGGHVRIFRDQALRKDIETAGFGFIDRHWAHGLHSPYWWLQCAMWEGRDTNWLVRRYHDFLVWDIVKQPALTRALAAVADPLMGKSVVLYFDRLADQAPQRADAA